MPRPLPSHPAAMAMRREGVPRTAEMRRIEALPTRQPNGAALVDEMTARLRLPGGKQVLSADQALALQEIADIGGGVCLMKPGSGKTHVGMLAFTVLNAQRPLYLCPSAAKNQILTEQLPVIRSHWRLNPYVMVRGFGELSSKHGRHLFEQTKPDVIVLDEMHKLANQDCARGNRIVEYIKKYPSTKLLDMTGSPFEKALECAHLFFYALRAGTPLPVDKDDIEAWTQAIGPAYEDWQRPGPGAMQVFIDLLPREKQREASDPVQLLRWGFKERLRLTKGVIVSSENPTETKIIIKSPTLKVPSAVREAFRQLAMWQVGEEELTDTFEMAAAARELICGFYYRWVWPGGKENTRWVEKRKEWHRFVRTIVVDRPTQQVLKRDGVLMNDVSKDERSEPIGLDSKGLVEDACKAHEAFEIAKRIGHPLAEQLAQATRFNCQQYRDWRLVKHEYDPVTEAVWLDEYLIDYAQTWLSQNNGVVWVPHRTVGAKLAERGIKYFGGGAEGAEIVRYRGPCAASFKSHHESKNLQHWSRGLYLLPPSTGQQWEQSIARFDRRGQQSATVDLEVLLLCRQTFNAFYKALGAGRYVHDGFDSQRICQADLSGVLTEADIEDVAEGEADPLWFT